jgi:hypothetical protein
MIATDPAVNQDGVAVGVRALRMNHLPEPLRKIVQSIPQGNKNKIRKGA